jgi:hypothetical protein
MARRKEPRIPDAILDQLLAGSDARTAFDQGGLMDELKMAFAERALNAEGATTWPGRLGRATAPTAMAGSR